MIISEIKLLSQQRANRKTDRELNVKVTRSNASWVNDVDAAMAQMKSMSEGTESLANWIGMPQCNWGLIGRPKSTSKKDIPLRTQHSLTKNRWVSNPGATQSPIVEVPRTLLVRLYNKLCVRKENGCNPGSSYHGYVSWNTIINDV